MLTPQFVLPIHAELVIDLFAGGGGASTGIEQAIGRHVDIAINHDPEAVALHQANHPQTLHYVSAQGLHHAEVRAFLVAYYGTDQDPKLGEPLHTVTTKHRFGLVTVKGQDYAIVDIGLRMLKRRELFRANGFDDSYIIEWGIHPHTGQKIALTNTVSIRLCGNCVCPPMAEAYVRANYRDQVPERMVA